MVFMNTLFTYRCTDKCVCVCVCARARARAYECNLPSVRCGPRLATTALFEVQCSAV